MADTKQINWEDLQKPVILKGENSDKYLFNEELDSAFNLIENYSILHNEYLEENSKKRYSETNSEDRFNTPMNIGVIGDRGTGKTSFLLSLKNKLETENYYVFDIVDPNLLSSDLNILEILISNIYKNISKNEINCVYKSQELICKLKSIMSALSIQRQGDSYFSKDTPSIDLLDKINNVVTLEKNIENLLKEFKDFLHTTNNKKYNDLVLIIDDLDLLENSHINKFLKQVQEHLNTKIILVFAYRQMQLENSLFDSKVKTNERLLNRSKITPTELDNQVENELLKLLPLASRIHLYTQDDLLKKSCVSIFESLGICEELRNSNNLDIENRDMRYDEWIFEKIFQATKLCIKPVDERENVKLFLPKSLREFVKFAAFISELKILSSSDDDKVYYENFSANCVKFKEFFLNTSIDKLATDEQDLIESWLYATSYQKNFLTFNYFLNKTKNSYFEYQELKGNTKIWDDYPFNLKTAQNFNLRLGDVFKIMETFKTYANSIDVDFHTVYIFKILYSLELLQLLISMISKKLENNFIDTDKDLSAYLDLINTSFMPQDTNYFSSKIESDKKDYIFAVPSIALEENDNAIFINSFLSSSVSSSSDIRRAINTNIGNLQFKRLYSYDILSTDNKYDKDIFNQNNQCFIDFYIPCTQKRYIIKAIENICDNDNNQTYFLLLSMFQIDNFVRITYSRRKPSINYKKYTKVIDSILDFFSFINTSKNTNMKSNIVRNDDFTSITKKDRIILSPYHLIFENKLIGKNIKDSNEIIIDNYKNIFKIQVEKTYDFIDIDDGTKESKTKIRNLVNRIIKDTANDEAIVEYLKPVLANIKKKYLTPNRIGYHYVEDSLEELKEILKEHNYNVIE